jgi:hypothetical protein
MNGQKDSQPPLRRQAGSSQKSAPDTEKIRRQSAGKNLAVNGLDHDQNEEVTKATILLFEHIEDQIGRADTKAQLILAADALLAGTLAALGKGAARSLLSNTYPVLNRLEDLFTILMFLALAGSFYYALRVINPHLRGSKRRTLMYFGQIARMSEDDFINVFGHQSLNDLQVSTLSQVHTKARIAQFKFAKVRWSVNFLIASLVFWALIQLLLAFS